MLVILYYIPNNKSIIIPIDVIAIPKYLVKLNLSFRKMLDKSRDNMKYAPITVAPITESFDIAKT